MITEAFDNRSPAVINPQMKENAPLENHTQYICGTCERCICIEHEPKHGLQWWNFPVKSLEIAKFYGGTL